jgi:hypothetical protein
MIVPEPYGYAVLLLITIIQKTVPCGRIKKLHAPVHAPPQRPPSYYTCLSEVFSRQQQGEQKYM